MSFKAEKKSYKSNQSVNDKWFVHANADTNSNEYLLLQSELTDKINFAVNVSFLEIEHTVFYSNLLEFIQLCRIRCCFPEICADS